ncbi:MAG: hypothetical protein QOG41_1944 [Thermoleophilaceae bacterium]|jgi:hypothetical protein|nr:hypothetical protein [Frankiaceae bacterium]MEA2308004.1 hypothetical protein [Thermoleophilaceae bacterium]MEA2350511.1 hypothetical protein [Thermoleophilaceae bacterium]MEA2352563.1 hypothetical protein [Thermoleophilaceae bacterium]MEA2367742.1 hypothetical protein [Thermoleophilaceae bacterium]
MGRGQIRVSDGEREDTVELLRKHYSEGRLTHDELEERVERAYHSTVRADLDELMFDLPSERGRRAAKRIERANRAAFRAHLTSYLGVNGGMVMIWAATGGGEFWPAWTMGPWGMFVAWHGLAARAVTSRVRRRGASGRGGSSRPPRALPR